jgi:hypothetical protein
VPPPRHRANRFRASDACLGDNLVRYVGAAVAAVLVTGIGAAKSSSHHEAAPVAEARISTGQVLVAPQPIEVKPLAAGAPAKKLATPKKKKAAVAKKAPVRKPAVKVVRWLPSGTGMWLHEFDQSQGGDGRAIINRAKANGLTHLFVQTGSSKKGPIGSPALRQVLPASKGTGIRVIAWDFANLRNPEADARRLATAARYHCGGCPRIAAVAPDIETAAEGTRINSSNVIRYYDELRHWLPADVSILATVPWPSEIRVNRYPYASTAARADAILPMAYWYNRSPAVVTSTSMTYFARFHKPVMPVGQGYDGRLDAPYLAPDPHPYLSVRSFLLTAKQHGAAAVSLWSWQTTGVQQWTALSRAKQLYSR